MRRTCLLLATVLLGGAAPLPGRNVLSDLKFFSSGPWIVWNGPWNAGRLRAGADFRDETTITEKFPAGTEIRWHWPPARRYGVYGYNQISWGSYDGGNPHQPIRPKQVRDIRRLVEFYDVTYSPDSGGEGNVLTELYLTIGPSSKAPKRVEVGFFASASQDAKSYVRHGKQIGTFVDPAGRMWQVAQQLSGSAHNYVMFIPVDQAPVLSGVIDWNAALRWLTSNQVVQSDWWFNGLAMGVEPVGGSGMMRVNDLRVEYR